MNCQLGSKVVIDKVMIVDDCCFLMTYWRLIFVWISGSHPTSGVITIFSCEISNKGRFVKKTKNNIVLGKYSDFHTEINPSFLEGIVDFD